MKKREYRTIFLLLSLITFLLTFQAQAQENYDDLYFYRVYFSDKGENQNAYSAGELLSPASIARREKSGITSPEENDQPVSSQYITAVTLQGLTYKCSSKWMNTAVFTSTEPANTESLLQLDFITAVKLVKSPAESSKRSYAKYGYMQSVTATTEAYDPRVPLNGNILHQSGFTGKNITIAVLDAGFLNADVIESLASLRERGGIVATHDFITGTDYVYDYHNHGTKVLSILAGDLTDIIHGTAPDADYILLRSEDNRSEFPVEEDYWAAAAEYADSAGADIISSSLGYFVFDDPSMSYSFSDMDGNRAFVTQAADIAASKGILVVASAGNERDNEWLRIIAPSDGNNVIGVGAVDHDLVISYFSSAGYSSDGRVKPDVVAPGVNLPVQSVPGEWAAGSGTSFSCPVISGLSASLMQAVPQSSPEEIISAIQMSCDRYNNPDTLYGYGLPDFLKALGYLEDIHNVIPEENITAGPNPFTDEINILFHDSPEYLTVTVVSNEGRIIMRKNYPVYAARSYRLDGLGNKAQGIYFIRVTTGIGEKTFKMIRIKQ